MVLYVSWTGARRRQNEAAQGGRINLCAKVKLFEGAALGAYNRR